MSRGVFINGVYFNPEALRKLSPKNFICNMGSEIINAIPTTAHARCYEFRSDKCAPCLRKAYRGTQYQFDGICDMLLTYECTECQFEFYAVSNECPLCQTIQPEKSYWLGKPPGFPWDYPPEGPIAAGGNCGCAACQNSWVTDV